jgi:hypothetical protein
MNKNIHELPKGLTYAQVKGKMNVKKLDPVPLAGWDEFYNDEPLNYDNITDYIPDFYGGRKYGGFDE